MGYIDTPLPLRVCVYSCQEGDRWVRERKKKEKQKRGRTNQRKRRRIKVDNNTKELCIRREGDPENGWLRCRT